MLFRYRIKGKVNSRFVLRGFLFDIGTKIDFCVSEAELDYVKANVQVYDVIDLQPEPIIETPEPIREEIVEEKVEKKEEKKSELHIPAKKTGRTNQTKSKAKV